MPISTIQIQIPGSNETPHATFQKENETQGWSTDVFNSNLLV